MKAPTEFMEPSVQMREPVNVLTAAGKFTVVPIRNDLNYINVVRFKPLTGILSVDLTKDEERQL